MVVVRRVALVGFLGLCSGGSLGRALWVRWWRGRERD